MTTHITVGFDASPEAEEALRWAAREAVARGVELEIVRTYRLPVAGDIQTGWIPSEAYGDMAETLTTELVEAREKIVADHPDLSVITDARAGSPMLLAEVGSSRVDLQACKLEYSIVSPK